MTETGQSIEDLVQLGLGARPPQVWSLLVTLFGDLAQTDGQEISAQLIGALAARMHVKPEATRVALHRLRKEGWIESRKVGRNSRYRLAQEGRAQTRAASPRIYGETQPVQRCWLALYDISAGPAQKGVALYPSAPQIRVTTEPPQGAFAFEITGEVDVPLWVRARLLPDDVLALARDVETRLRGLLEGLSRREVSDPKDIAALRLLVVHQWRRLILRVPAVPDHVLPDGTGIAESRALKTTLLQMLPRPEVAHLDTL
ncbi:PaaX family transcriptional regulator C-terminal domain-containing protein [Primorskyibacter sp. S187A]|uniref:PaaX family transcriptional regulator C-terminal domain-containing protein n=1 Tax=Primorskyibacter sp. S187A TaxID=3415130 RepID=UPI003C7A3939